MHHEQYHLFYQLRNLNWGDSIAATNSLVFRALLGYL
jgi:hypothetical protein